MPSKTRSREDLKIVVATASGTGIDIGAVDLVLVGSQGRYLLHCSELVGKPPGRRGS